MADQLTPVLVRNFRIHVVEYDRLGTEQLVTMHLDHTVIAVCSVTPRNTWFLKMAHRRKRFKTTIGRTVFDPVGCELHILHMDKKYIINNAEEARDEIMATFYQCKHDLGLSNEALARAAGSKPRCVRGRRVRGRSTSD